MENILSILDPFPQVEEEAKTAFGEKLQWMELERGELIEKSGTPCDHLYFVIDGSLRSFYLKDDKDVTVSFTLKGEFTTSMYSFISRNPSYENIEAMETTRLARIHHQDLMGLFDLYQSLERVYRLLLEQYYISLEEQLVFAKFKSAKDRYLELMENRPKIIQKASVGQIASYLDMSIETLSRIRAKI
ncbi:Crp/Fnr family transcriptional regulator [Algoriphagus confluentis]|uniref:Crp/Fnr family transcriptional regulator n=1 Tax=Algoriphagus confluentis TaxID=1697556 RepID=A0ABQ6PQU5_9BACT|nr:Crp/Fnr family transcriptional regulator [Algoriphagus confluentis]